MMTIKGLDKWLTTPPDDGSDFIEAVSEKIPVDIWDKYEDYLTSSASDKMWDRAWHFDDMDYALRFILRFLSIYKPSNQH